MRRDIYFGQLKLSGYEHLTTLVAANNYAAELGRFDEAKSVLRKVMPVARRVMGENDDVPLKMRIIYAKVRYCDAAATLDDLREAVTTLAEMERTARRVLGGAHPSTTVIEASLQNSRATLRARETPSPAESA